MLVLHLKRKSNMPFVIFVLNSRAHFNLGAQIWCPQNRNTDVQKQPSIGVLIKRCSENIPQIYRRTPIPKCDFNNVS